MSKYKFLCVVAGQRAGTTALHSALAATGLFYNFGEIFHTENSSRPGRFINFSRENKILLSDVATYDGAAKIANNYISHLKSISSGKIALIDVKFNSWRALNPFWMYIHQIPFFLDILIKKRECYFLFVRREDILEQVLSEQIARNARKWHGIEKEDMDSPVTVNVDALRKQARLIIQSENYLWPIINRTGSAVSIRYEDLFHEDSVVNKNLALNIEDAFSLKFKNDLRPIIQKNAVNKRVAIANYDDAAAAVAEVEEKFKRINIDPVT